MQTLDRLIPNKKVHFIGIGGVGMSALAMLLLEQGYYVIGSDIKSSKKTDRLQAKGAVISFGHKKENIKDVDIVVYSSCIKEENPEVVQAKQKNIPLIQRGKLLSVLMQGKQKIVIAGAHGKTTTTSMISLLLQNAGLNPSYAIGADVDLLKGNAGYGLGKYFVAEADESDGSFVFLDPDYAVITNIDKEHLDYYQDIESIIDAYKEFISKINPQGILFYWADDLYIEKALKNFRGHTVSYGFSKKADLQAVNLKNNGMDTEFECIYKGEISIRFTLSVPGSHNVLNALACIAVGIKLGIDFDVMQKTLTEFKGAKRRFEIKSKTNDVIIVDDYAHHPTEIKATLLAAKAWPNRRVIGVFQPHRYSRTKFLQQEFGHCFDNADQVIITDIYAASEQPIDGIAAKTIYEQVKNSGHKDVCFYPRNELKEYLVSTLKKGDLVMMLGAGDINALSDELSRDFADNVLVK